MSPTTPANAVSCSKRVGVAGDARRLEASQSPWNSVCLHPKSSSACWSRLLEKLALRSTSACCSRVPLLCFGAPLLTSVACCFNGSIVINAVRHARDRPTSPDTSQRAIDLRWMWPSARLYLCHVFALAYRRQFTVCVLTEEVAEQAASLLYCLHPELVRT